MTTRRKAAAGDEMADLVATAEADGEHPTESVNEAADRIFGPDVVKRPVIAKLARIMADIPTLEPLGRNQHFGYGFIKDTQVSGAIRPRMAAAGLMVIPEVLEESWVQTVTRSGGISWVTKLKVQFTVIDGDSGDYVIGVGFGYGDDSGDKGANKALTAAMKYWLIKLFQIGGEDDLEADNRADQRAGDRMTSGTGGGASVTVEGAVISGVARGGRSDKVTGTQNRQIAALIKEMEMTPEAVVDFLKAHDRDIQVPDEGELGQAINAFMLAQTADDAGALITLLVTERDNRAAADIPDDTEEDDPSGGYTG